MVEHEPSEMSPADKAVTYILDRAQTDADLGYLIGPCTESFTLLCQAEACRTGESVEAVKARRSKRHYRWPRQYLSEREWEEKGQTTDD